MGTKAKRIRREVYGEDAPKLREYVRTAAGPIMNRAHLVSVSLNDGVVKIPKRKIYQMAKQRKLVKIDGKKYL